MRTGLGQAGCILSSMRGGVRWPALDGGGSRRGCLRMALLLSASLNGLSCVLTGDEHIFNSHAAAKTTVVRSTATVRSKFGYACTGATSDGKSWTYAESAGGFACGETCRARTDYGDRCVEFARNESWCRGLLTKVAMASDKVMIAPPEDACPQ